MGSSVASLRDHRLSFSSGEVTGAIGDTITVLPLVVALALLTSISLPHVLIAFGVFQITWGIVYGVPISVEPMKALAALAIAGTLGYADLALAGLVLGILLLAIGLTGTLARVRRWIGEPVIRGVQLAVALILFETGIRLGIDDPRVGAGGVIVVGGLVIVGQKKLSAIVLLGIGIAIAIAAAGLPGPTVPGGPPLPSISGIGSVHVADGIVAQLAMTIGNAALATSLLVSDLFDRKIAPDSLSTSMGITNLIAVPIGGIPMCHGCDGIAGKYEFGARTGGANVILGLGYLVAAIFTSVAILRSFPLALLGVLLVLVAISLGRSVRKSNHLSLSVGIGLLALVTNLGLAFAAGIAAHLLLERIAKPA